MSKDFQLVGENYKTGIEAAVDFDDGGMILAEPGTGFCDSRLLFMRQLSEGLVANGFYDDVFDLTEMPRWMSTQYAFRFHCGLHYDYFDLLDIDPNDSHIVTHPPDRDGKRYVEAWGTFYPAAYYVGTVHDYDDTGLMVGTISSDLMAVKFRRYPVVHQTLTLPASLSAVYNGMFVNNWRYGVDDVETSIIYIVTRATHALVVYRYDEGTRLLAEDFVWEDPLGDCASIIGYAINGREFALPTDSYGPYDYPATLVITYQNVNNANELTLATFERDITLGTWSLLSRRVCPSSYSDVRMAVSVRSPAASDPVMGSEDHKVQMIVLGGIYGHTSFYRLDDLTYWKRAGDIDDDMFDWTGRKYTYFTGSSYGWNAKGDGIWSFLGFGRYELSSGSVSAQGSAGVSMHDNASYEGNTTEDQRIATSGYWQYHYGTGITAIIKTDDGGLWGYTYYLTDYQTVGRKMSLYGQGTTWFNSEYIFNAGNTELGVSDKVFYCTSDEPLVLEDYSAAIHKPVVGSANLFRDVMFIGNNQDGTVKTWDYANDYSVYLSGDVTLKYTTVSNITTISDFFGPAESTHETFRYLFSYDNVTFYKWTGSAWVAETDPSLGMTEAQFVAGAAAGYTAPDNWRQAYVKIYLETDGTGWTSMQRQDAQLEIQVISVANNAYYLDDSKVRIEHLSDRQTKITNITGQRCIIHGHLAIIAPPYNVDYEDAT